jgi:glycosyltransferase involved in cell wall biosynthesis
MIKIIHLITDLEVGGAEKMLLNLMTHMDRKRFQNTVVSLAEGGALRKDIAGLGISVSDLGMRLGVPNPMGIWRLCRILRKERAMALQTWLYHADLLGLVVGKLTRIPLICWNIRCSDMDMQYYSRLSRLVTGVLPGVSSLPYAVLVNSMAGMRAHERLGYRPQRWILIPNGFDVEVFHPDSVARTALRQELGLREDDLLIGLVSRFDPMKDHKTFLQASKLLLKNYPSVQFVMAGSGIDPQNQSLVACLGELGLSRNFVLLGERRDIHKVMAALDIATSSSASEGFPNTIGEAMACAVPCVVTDVGDSGWLVRDTGKVVAPKDPKALADAWQQVIELGEAGRRKLGLEARRRIEKEFSLSDSVGRYERFYEKAAADVRVRRF